MALAAPTDPTLPTFTGVYVFGDSLVDPGNALRAAELVAQFPFIGLPERAPTADKGYFGGRFTDGYNFADLVSNKMVLAPTQTTFPYGFEDPVFGIDLPFVGKPSGTNLSFAYGGAQAMQGDEDVPDLDDQTDAYRNFPAADPNALYIVTMGGNDVRELVPNTGEWAGAAKAAERLDDVGNAIAVEVGQLFQFGARHVLVTGIPDIGLLPSYIGSANESARRGVATQYSAQLDDLLAIKLGALTLPVGSDLRHASLMDFSSRLLVDPGAFHLTNLTQARTVVQSGGLDGTGTSGFLFFDDVHPSAQVHALFAADILDSLRQPAPAEAAAQATPLSSSIEAPGDLDDFTVVLTAARSYVFDLLGLSDAAGTLADPRLTLFDGATALSADDDSGLGLDAHFSFVAPHSGIFTLQVGAVGVTAGSYRLQAAEANGRDLLLSGRLRGSDETVTGGAGDDTVIAEAGTNALAGAAGSDVLTGGLGTDSINGNMGDDVVRGRAGADTVFGGRGNDTVFGDQDSDFLSGDLGNDSVNGNAGTDLLSGGAGADTVRGGQGSDVLFGGDGNDWLSGDLGADTIAGGPGSDLFYAFSGSGADLITDFSRPDGDRIGVAQATQYSVSQIGADVLVTVPGGGQLTLVGVQLSTLSDGWLVAVD